MTKQISYTTGVNICLAVLLCTAMAFCSKGGGEPAPQPPAPQPPANFKISYWYIGRQLSAANVYDVPLKPLLQFAFTAPVNRSAVAEGISLLEAGGTTIPITASFSNADSVVTLTPTVPLTYLRKYFVQISN